MGDTLAGNLPTADLVGGTPIYLTGEDALRLSVLNGAAGVTVELTGRFLPARVSDSEPIPRVGPFVHPLTPATDRSVSSVIRGLGEGWLLDWCVVVTAGSPLVGQCYAKVAIVRGVDASARLLSVLGRGYVTAKQELAWPGSRFEGFLDTPGALRSITGTAPAAGVDIVETAPAGVRWELLSFFATLTTAATVANRVPMLILDDGVHTFNESSQQQQQAASLTWDYLWSPGDQNQAAGNRLVVTASLGNPVFLGAGFRMRTNTSAIQAADQWSAPQYVVREWIEGQ